MTVSTFIFNQYYIDLLKKIKTIAKKHKDKSKTAKTVLKSIKDNYTSLDKSSDEYITFLNNNISDSIWESYYNLENNENINDWFKNNDFNIYIDISLNDITKLLRDNYLCHHYITVFYIFKNSLSNELSEKIVKILQTINNKDAIEEIEDEKLKVVIKRLEELRNISIKEKSGIDMKCIEDTSLGKLAKEILEDIDINKLHKSMGDNGDILKAISDPDSGFTDLISNVSRKMATKMANGELKQETLLQDAMKFASLMPGMFNNNNKNPNNKSTANMPDLSNMMNMMNMMMSGAAKSTNEPSDKSDEKNENCCGNSCSDSSCDKNAMPSFFNDLLKNVQQQQPKGSKTAINKDKLKKMDKINQLRSKLEKKKNNCE